VHRALGKYKVTELKSSICVAGWETPALWKYNGRILKKCGTGVSQRM